MSNPLELIWLWKQNFLVLIQTRLHSVCSAGGGARTRTRVQRRFCLLCCVTVFVFCCRWTWPSVWSTQTPVSAPTGWCWLYAPSATTWSRWCSTCWGRSDAAAAVNLCFGWCLHFFALNLRGPTHCHLPIHRTPHKSCPLPHPGFSIYLFFVLLFWNNAPV